MKYKIGDKVFIVDLETKRAQEESGFCLWNPRGEMDKHCGTTMTISNINTQYNYYEMLEDDINWCWYPEMIECLESEIDKDIEISPDDNSLGDFLNCFKRA